MKRGTKNFDLKVEQNQTETERDDETQRETIRTGTERNELE